jgi:hypothetical protein
MADDEKFLFVFHQLLNIFAKKRERWIGDNNVGLFQKRDTFVTAKVAVAFEMMYADFLGVRQTVATFVAVILEIDTLFRLVRTEQISVLVLVAGGDELLEFQLLEIVGEVMEEIADAGVVTIAEHGLALEVLGVMAESFSMSESWV